MPLMSNPRPSIIIAAGGTGGHVFPAIAIADALRKLRPEAMITFVGTRNKLEWQAVPKAGYPIRSVWISGFHRRLTLQNILFPLKLVVSLFQSYRIIQSLKPDVFISCGGYVAGPTGWVAGKKKILSVIQEQNSFPGVTNRMLANKASIIYTAFQQADQWLPAGKTKLLGNPTRSNLRSVSKEDGLKHFGLATGRKTILILGGSGGALSINEAVLTHLPMLMNELNVQLIWQSGTRYLTSLRDRIDTASYPDLILTDFIHNMPAAFAAADLVISRAGASSCAELMLTGKPSILIPSPNVAGNHQMMNAKAMTESGAAKVLADIDAKQSLGIVIANLINDDVQLRLMSESMTKMATPNAADDIARDILDRLDRRIP
jgi:UDP-N-acetylglucosamine--N-acetylmuramyl-(pentapeptide) pyrophosphoryl-undecaprenol N-acetylglucosamine transferase